MARRPLNQPYTITQEFGVPDSRAKFDRHAGVDYGIPVGREIYAPTSGTVTDYTYGQYHGNVVQIYDGRYYYRMMHLSQRLVQPGTKVTEGQLIGKSGATGQGITGPHLHFDIATQKIPTSFAAFIDPWTWLNSAPTPPPALTLQPYQRKAGSEGVNERVAPSTSAAIHKEWPAGDIFDFKGYVRGQPVNGNNIWFVGKYNGRYFWSGAFEDKSTHDLPDLTAAPAPEPAPPQPSPIPDHSQHVIDISNHNKVLDYNAVKNSVRAVVAKAGHTGKSYGGTSVNGDPTFAAHKANLGDKLVGAYWYAYPSLDWLVEAKAFIETVGEVPDTFSYWLDIEELDGQTKEQVNEWCANFLQYVETTIRRKCGLYMNRNWFDNYISDDVKNARPIWLAHYDTPEMSNPVANQVAHQFTSSGRVNGMEGNIDINAVTPGFFIPPSDPPTPPIPEPPPPIDDKIEKIDAFLRENFRRYE